MIEIVLTVCAIANPANCEDKYLQFAWDGSLNQCMMAAQPYIAQWIGNHPQWTATKWTCENPGHGKRKIGFGPCPCASLVSTRVCQFGPKATPQGNSPTWMDLMTF